MKSDNDFVEYILEHRAELGLEPGSYDSEKVVNLSGNINRVRRVVLSRDGKKASFVVKHVPEGGFLERYPEVVFPESRLDYEMIWFERTRLSSADMRVRVPQVFLFDRERRTIVMEDVTESVLLSTWLSQGSDGGRFAGRNATGVVAASTGSVFDMEPSVVLSELGRFLGRVHASSVGLPPLANPAAAANRPFVFTVPFTQPDLVRQIWLERERERKGSDGPSDRSGPTAAACIALQESFLGEWGSILHADVALMEASFKLASPQVFTHGDLHCGSVLVSPDGSAVIVDAELSDTGAAWFDTGMLVAHLWASVYAGGGERADAMVVGERFWRSYAEQWSDTLSPGDLARLAGATVKQAGAEIIRRSIGAAGFPFPVSIEDRRRLLAEAPLMITEPERFELAGGQPGVRSGR